MKLAVLLPSSDGSFVYFKYELGEGSDKITNLSNRTIMIAWCVPTAWPVSLRSLIYSLLKSCLDHSLLVGSVCTANSQCLNIHPGATFITVRLCDGCLIGLRCEFKLRV